MLESYYKEFLGRNVFVIIDHNDYEPDKSHDGGSYYQPYIIAEYGDKRLSIDDNSCGDFGTRIYVSLYNKDTHDELTTASYGSLATLPYTLFSISNDSHVFWLAFAREILGYNIPYNEEGKDNCMKYYFMNSDVDPDLIYGNDYPVCLDEAEYSRLIDTEGWTDLPELMHEADPEEIEAYGYYDSSTNEVHYGTVYENKSPWENN